jgi:hypothetical protein
MAIFAAGVDFPVFRTKYQKTDAGFGFPAPNYLYGQVFRSIGRFLKNGNFSPRGVLQKPKAFWFFTQIDRNFATS